MNMASNLVQSNHFQLHVMDSREWRNVRVHSNDFNSFQLHVMDSDPKVGPVTQHTVPSFQLHVMDSCYHVWCNVYTMSYRCLFQLHVMDSAYQLLWLLTHPNIVFQLHVMDSEEIRDFCVEAIDPNLSTPCYGFLLEVVDVARLCLELNLSTPCYGFTNVRRGTRLRQNRFQLHVMDSNKYSDRAPMHYRVLSTPCYGFFYFFLYFQKSSK